MLSLRYAPALEAYLEASALAERAGDWSALGGIAVNLALLYQRMGDARRRSERTGAGKDGPGSPANSAALQGAAADEPQERPRRLQENSTNRTSSHAMRMRSRRRGRRRSGSGGRGVGFAGRGRDSPREHLNGAEAALGTALRLRTSYCAQEPGFFLRSLGRLAAGAGQVEPGAKSAIGEPKRQRPSHIARSDLGPPGPRHLRAFPSTGRDPRRLGQTELALEDFRTAVNKASQWNGTVPAAFPW